MLALDRLEGVARLAVDGDDERLRAREGQHHDARVAEIGQAQPHPGAGREALQGRRSLAVDAEQRADPADAACRRRIVEAADDLAGVIKPPVVEHEEQVGVCGQRRRLIDDQQALEAAPDKLRRRAIDARPVAEQAGIGEPAAVIEGPAGRDRRLRQRGDALHRIVAAQAMPVNGCGLVKLVEETDGEVVALLVAQDGPGRDPVETENAGFAAAGQARLPRPRLELPQGARRRLRHRRKRRQAGGDAGKNDAAGEGL